MSKHRGSCLCGAIAYEYEDPVMDFHYCHCSRCRKATGSAYISNIFVLPSQFQWTAGEEIVMRYDLPEARSFATCFCKICGSPLPHMTRSGERVVIPAGSLDDDPDIKPTCGIWWSEKAPWFVPSTEIPEYDKEDK